MSTPAPTWSARMVCPTTNGEPMMWSMLLLALLMSAGCAGSSTLQVLQAAHKTEAQQTQRLVTDLRAELQALQRELGTARAAQTRLEGDLREAHRQLTEAKHVVDLQREELVRARDERERDALATREMQEQLVELGRDQTRLQSLEAAVEAHAKELARLKASKQKSSRSKTKPTGAGAAPPIVKGSPNGVITTDGVDRRGR